MKHLVKQYFTFFFIAILLITFLLRIIPLYGNNFYFTIDQGRDAVYVRDILHGHLKLLGPQTSLPDIHHGVLWYYLLTLPYLLFQGSPLGAVVFLVVINTSMVALVMKFFKKMYTEQNALLVGILLAVFLPFYETSRYAFNPFLLPALAIGSFIALSLVQQKKSSYFLLFGALTGIVFHAEIIAFPPFLASFLTIGALLLYQKKISSTQLISAGGITFIFLVPHILSELQTGFAQTNVLLDNFSSNQSIVATNLFQRLQEVGVTFYTLIGESVFPQIPLVGGIIFFVVTGISVWKVKKEVAVPILFSFLLLISSLVLFSFTSLFRPWYIVYLPPLLLLAFILQFATLTKKWLPLLLFILIALQGIQTNNRVQSYMKDRDDAGLLSNQLKALDWIYEKSENQGFNLYFYVPSVYDYHYQYLTYHYGKKHYNYLPCEYSTYPGIDASSYVPHASDYQQPQKPCDSVQFMLFEPPVDQGLQDIWKSEVSKNTQLLDQKTIGNIRIEKRKTQ